VSGLSGVRSRRRPAALTEPSSVRDGVADHPALREEVGPAAGRAADGVEGGVDRRPVVGEALPHLDLRLEARHQHAVSGAQHLVELGAELVEDALAAARVDVRVVDHQRQAEALVLGQRLGVGRVAAEVEHRRGGLAGLEVAPRPLLDGVEVGQLHALAVLEDDEVVAGEAANRVAAAVGDHHLEVDHVDLDAVEEDLDGGLLGVGGGDRRGDGGEHGQYAGGKENAAS
jgi:hypothetical protein